MVWWSLVYYVQNSGTLFKNACGKSSPEQLGLIHFHLRFSLGLCNVFWSFSFLPRNSSQASLFAYAFFLFFLFHSRPTVVPRYSWMWSLPLGHVCTLGTTLLEKTIFSSPSIKQLPNGSAVRVVIGVPNFFLHAVRFRLMQPCENSHNHCEFRCATSLVCPEDMVDL